MANLIYKEEQSYRGTWLMYLLLMIEIPTISLVSFIIWRTEKDSNTALLSIGLLILILSMVFFFLMSLKLETRIDSYGVKFKFFPFINQWRTLSKGDIKTIGVINYSPLTDYGGWGLKGNRTTKAYSILGDQGILIDIGQKKKILIGTQKGSELKSYLEDWQKEE
jgi:hypothetical protein